MSRPHRSTPEHWATVERYAQQVSSTDDCLLELRARVEALEAAENYRQQDEDAERAASAEARPANDQSVCPHVVTSGEGTSYCRLAEQRHATSPTSSLVEKVALKIAHKGCFLPTDVYGEDARAAIREVAAWLRAGRMLHAADLLEQEVGR